MISEDELVAILNEENGACSIEREILTDNKISIDRVSKNSGRAFTIETFVIPNPQGGLAIPSEIVRFLPKEA